MSHIHLCIDSNIREQNVLLLKITYTVQYLNQNSITDLPAYCRPCQQQETPEESL